MSDLFKRKEIRERMERLKQHPIIAELAFVYGNIVDRIRVTDGEIKRVIQAASKHSKGKDINEEGISYKELLREIVRLKKLDINVDSIEGRDILKIISEELKATLRQQSESKLKVYIEAILLGLISAGIFEVIRYALATLVGRAPYPEAQIYEIECDIFREYTKWHDAASVSLQSEGEIQPELLELLLIYTLHGLCVLSVLGPNVNGTPLFRTATTQTWREILRKNPPSWWSE